MYVPYFINEVTYSDYSGRCMEVFAIKTQITYIP